MKMHSIGQVMLDPELERHFEQYQKNGGDHRALAVALLGDDTYVKQVRMPKYNVPVDMLREPRVAVRYSNAWGIPTSKDAHRQRADYFVEVIDALGAAWSALVERYSQLFGRHGALVSGVYRDHFPVEAKERLRFLSRGRSMAVDAERLHRYLSKTHSPLFQ